MVDISSTYYTILLKITYDHKLVFDCELEVPRVLFKAGAHTGCTEESINWHVYTVYMFVNEYLS